MAILRLLLAAWLCAWTFQLQAEVNSCETPAVLVKETLRVASLNLAHGRKDARNQMLLKAATIRSNLLEVAALMDRAAFDVIALQEADAVSAWSGRFDHVALLAEHSTYRCFVHGLHATSSIYQFGTALMSPHAFDGAFTHSFVPSPPTTTKGFSTAAIAWNPGGRLPSALRMIFVSVHLDFSRRSVRRSQIDEMVEALDKLQRPLVLMGDFNTDWQTEESSLKYLAEALDLHVFEPHAEGLSTYGDKGARLDWILVSKDLDFARYHVEPDVVSDHYAVAAELVFVGEGAP